MDDKTLIRTRANAAIVHEKNGLRFAVAEINGKEDPRYVVDQYGRVFERDGFRRCETLRAYANH